MQTGKRNKAGITDKNVPLAAGGGGVDEKTAGYAVVPNAAGYQYILGGSCWLRRRFCKRLAAAAFLRLRSVVGFS